MTTTVTTGFLGSYRYDVTPRSALELNYGFAQNSIKYLTPSIRNGEVHSRDQEISGAYVYSRNYGNFNPFLQAGTGVIAFSPIRDSGTHQLDAKRTTSVGLLFGGGLAYEISPSFDVRVEYRGFLLKAPSFGYSDFDSKRYYVISMPAIGIAYHF
jgi:opacity protein-like surface antigen